MKTISKIALSVIAVAFLLVWALIAQDKPPAPATPCHTQVRCETTQDAHCQNTQCVQSNHLCQCDPKCTSTCRCSQKAGEKKRLFGKKDTRSPQPCKTHKDCPVKK